VVRDWMVLIFEKNDCTGEPLIAQFLEDGTITNAQFESFGFHQGVESAIVPPGLQVRIYYASTSDFTSLYGDVEEPYTCQSLGALTGRQIDFEIDVPDSPDSVPASTPDVEFYKMSNCEGPVFTHALPEGSSGDHLSEYDLDSYAGSIHSLRVADLI